MLRMCQDAGTVRKEVERTRCNEKGKEITQMVCQDGQPEAELKQCT